jgi:beta-lactamase class A
VAWCFFRGVALTLVVGLLAACSPPPKAPNRSGALEAELARIAASAGGAVSVTALNLRTGERAAVGGQVPRPMMSIFKLPLAVAALVDVDSGSLRLDQQLPLVESELRAGGPIADAWKKGEREPTVDSMLVHMLRESDSTAGDKMVAVLGGGARVTARLRSQGLDGITITGPEIARDAALDCVGEPVPDEGWTPDEIAACSPPSAAALAAAVQKEVAAPPDSATTDAMVDLLAQLDAGTILTTTSRRWLLSTLAETPTGPARIRGLLPPGAAVAHKTGTGRTLGGARIAIGDVGIVSPPGGDRFAIAVMIAGSRASLDADEGTIARLAKAAWDAFATQPKP